MNHKKALKNIIGVTLSNCSTILAGVMIGFVIPKIFTVSDYGLYKTFTLYTNYIGLFSIGIIDGIVLDYGMYDYEELDRRKFRGFFKWYILVHAIVCVILLSISFFTGDRDRTFIIVALAADILAVNTTGYYQQISQITQRFRELSLRKILQSIANILVVGALLLVSIRGGSVGYQIYIIIHIAVCMLLTIWYVYTYREISFGKGASLRETGREIGHLIKIGFPLLFANLCSTLILTLDRQFVNVLFTNTEYAVYAFAYNMLSLVTVATSAISTVLYPILKRTTPDTLKKNYSDLVSVMLVFVYAALIVYFPLCAFVKWFLPKYTDSLVIFRVIFPGIAISSSITVVMHNYYKTLGDNIKYFRKSILVLLLSAAANGIAYLIFKTTVSISVASIITMIVWYLYVEQYFVHNYGYSRWRNFGYLLLMMGYFYGITCIDNWLVSGLLYIAGYAVITFLMEKETIRSAKRFLKK